MLKLRCKGQVLPPTLTVKAAATLAGCGVSAAYEACRQGRWPALRITERRIVVITTRFLEMLGLELDADVLNETLAKSEPMFPIIRPQKREICEPDPKLYRTVVVRQHVGSETPTQRSCAVTVHPSDPPSYKQCYVKIVHPEEEGGALRQE